jgi:hypothetical protein
MSFLYRYFIVLTVVFSFICSEKVLGQADYGSTIEVIYSNLNIINNSIYTIKNQMKNLEGSLQKQLRAQIKSLEENKTDIQMNKQEISAMKSKMIMIDSAYEKVHKKYAEIIAGMGDMDYRLLKVDSSFVDINQEMTDLRNKFIFLTTEYFELKNQFSKIPEIMFCQNCNPKLFFGVSNNEYINSSYGDFVIENSIALDCGYIYQNFIFWLNYNSPDFITIYEDKNAQLKICDKWKTNIVTFGLFYNLFSERNINFRLGTGFFYGLAQFDKFSNSDFGFSRENQNDVSSIGFTAKIELSYNEFYSKLPMEVYIGISSLHSLEKISMNPGLGKIVDLGNSLFYVNFGFRLNFWTI